MSILLARPLLEVRRKVVRSAFPDLLSSLQAELDQVIAGDPLIPEVKARLTRWGGRCERDGTTLLFDPFSPRAHRCPQCGAVYDGEIHHQRWVLSQQLFLAERAVHAALLGSLLGEPRYNEFAAKLLSGFAERYMHYPNSDNVLGPGRPFFSTYLESIWLLQIVVALGLLESGSYSGPVGEMVRVHVVAPSSELIASYREGKSNRELWHVAARLAAARGLGDTRGFSSAVADVCLALDGALLPDGTWHEGENYHLFAHRALWYIVRLCDAASAELPGDVRLRYLKGFPAPFRSVLPDHTLLARKDSQFGISIHQWRFAELCELGIAECADGTSFDEDERVAIAEQLSAVLRVFYNSGLARGETGRWRSTAEVEWNTSGVALSRSDLSWKSLLFACEAIAGGRTAVPWRESVLLRDQGLGILREESGAVFASLDYGEHGGGHGHPDRLNVALHTGGGRWLDDYGTGSYVDDTLFWYRSGLAHNAPSLLGVAQSPAPGELVSFNERECVARFEDRAHGVAFLRSVELGGGYLVDQLVAASDSSRFIQLPLHLGGADVEQPGGNAGGWVPLEFRALEPEAAVAELTRHAAGVMDAGFRYLSAAAVAEPGAGGALRASSAAARSVLRSWLQLPSGSKLYRLTAPGPPGGAARSFLLVVTSSGGSGVLLLHDWTGSVRGLSVEGDEVQVELADIGVASHRLLSESAPAATLRAAPSGFRGGLTEATSRTRASGGVSGSGANTEYDFALIIPCVPGTSTEAILRHPPSAALRIPLTERSFRRGETTWVEHGSPEGDVALVADSDALYVSVAVRAAVAEFGPAPGGDVLDNEPAGVNSHGVQLHLAAWHSGAVPPAANFLLVPDPVTGEVKVTPRYEGSGAIPLSARWEARSGGYVLVASLDRSALHKELGEVMGIDVIVNLRDGGRERRSGQLVASGGRGEWVFLRGDRQPLTHLFPVRIAHE